MQEISTSYQRLQHYQYNMEAYEAYKIYHALKLHFNSDYDYTKYNGKAKVTVDSYLKRKDRPFFAKVARKYMTPENTKNFFVSNFIVNPKGWVGNFNEENYSEYRKRNQSLKYNYKNELNELFQKISIFDELFHVKEGQHPLLLKQFLAKKVSLETMCIMESLLEYCKYWNEDIEEQYVWKEQEKLIKNYSSVLTFDKSLYKIITMSTLKECLNG